MKLARTTHIVTHELSRGSRSSRRTTRLVSTRAFSLQRHPSRLVARWHVCPETHRLECSKYADDDVTLDFPCFGRGSAEYASPCLARTVRLEPCGAGPGPTLRTSTRGKNDAQHEQGGFCATASKRVALLRRVSLQKRGPRAVDARETDASTDDRSDLPASLLYRLMA